MSDKIKISVIIPVYNGEKFLAQSVDSVIGQKYQNIEIVAVNDGSTDSSVEILERYKDRVQIIHQNNAGQASARNNGILHAKGDWIAFLDQDDLWDQEKISEQMKVAIQDEYTVIYTASRLIDDLGRNLGVSESDIKKDNISLLDLLPHNPIITSTALVRRNAIIEVGMLDSTNRFGTDDYDLWLALAATKHRFHYIPLDLASYRLHGNNMSTNSPLLCQGKIYVLNRISAKYPVAFGSKEKRELLRRFTDIDVQTGTYYMRNNNYKKASESFFQALKRQPWRIKIWMLFILNILPFKASILSFARLIIKSIRT
jgi:glycosyltransferase involved in cell wall biosynthesis